jgi:outer membrane protein TolC
VDRQPAHLRAVIAVLSFVAICCSAAAPPGAAVQVLGIARRDEAVIVAEKVVANAEDRLRLLILNPRAPQYHTPFEPTDSAGAEIAAAGVAPATRALTERSDLKVLRSAIETNVLNVRQLKNEALPDINLSAGFSSRAVGGTELIREGGLGTPVVGSLERGFGPVLGDLGQLRYPGWSMQVSIGYPVGAVVAKVDAARAQVEKRQNELSLAAEEEKFLVGLSTSFFVFQAQRDLASARVARLGAVLDRRLSLADLEAVQTAPLTPIR